MKYWEMCKELSENTDKIFRHDIKSGDYCIATVKCRPTMSVIVFERYDKKGNRAYHEMEQSTAFTSIDNDWYEVNREENKNTKTKKWYQFWR